MKSVDQRSDCTFEQSDPDLHCLQKSFLCLRQYGKSEKSLCVRGQ